jgi:hypothetical protein
MTINHIPELTDEELRWALQRLFPYPEDMGPHLSDRYKVFIRCESNRNVGVYPMSSPSSEIFYVNLI